MWLAHTAPSSFVARQMRVALEMTQHFSVRNAFALWRASPQRLPNLVALLATRVTDSAFSRWRRNALERGRFRTSLHGAMRDLSGTKAKLAAQAEQLAARFAEELQKTERAHAEETETLLASSEERVEALRDEMRAEARKAAAAAAAELAEARRVAAEEKAAARMLSVQEQEKAVAEMQAKMEAATATAATQLAEAKRVAEEEHELRLRAAQELHEQQRLASKVEAEGALKHAKRQSMSAVDVAQALAAKAQAERDAIQETLSEKHAAMEALRAQADADALAAAKDRTELVQRVLDERKETERAMRAEAAEEAPRAAEQRGVRARVRLLPAAVVDALALQALVLELLTHDAAVTADLCHVQRTEVAIVGVVDQHVVCGEVVGLWCVWRRGADACPVEAPLDDLDRLHRPSRCVASHRADEWGRGDTRWGQTTRTNEGLQGCARAPPQVLQEVVTGTSCYSQE